MAGDEEPDQAGEEKVMAQNSNIEWTDATWNPWYGCLKVSPGCKLCYMYREMARYGRDPRTVTRSKTKFNDPLKWVKAGNAPKFCFTCSWSDFFIEQADAWRPEAWDIIRQTPQTTYQILTKRPERIIGHLPEDWGFEPHDGYRNVWLLTSCENQKAADARIDILRSINARVLGLSLEPLLGPIVLRAEQLRDISWVIVGGESGPGARPMHPDWARSLRDQCKSAGVPFFFKQWGAWAPGECGDKAPIRTERVATYFANKWDYSTLTPKRSEEMHRDDQPDVYLLGKKAAGRLLDGVEHSEYPEVMNARS
jgi:protein gp37